MSLKTQKLWNVINIDKFKHICYAVNTAKDKELNMLNRNYVQRMIDDNMCDTVVKAITSKMQGSAKYAKYFATKQGVIYLDLFDKKGRLVKEFKITDFSCEEKLNNSLLASRELDDNYPQEEIIKNIWFKFLDRRYPTFKKDYLAYQMSVSESLFIQ